MTIRFIPYLLSCATLLCVALPSNAQAQERERRVGVTISAYFNTDAEMADAISEAVGRALTKTLKVQTIAGQAAQSKLPESARSETCIGDSDCLIAAGQALGVDELLMLIVVGGGDELKIEATWASMDTSETALRPSIVVPLVLDEMERILASQATSLIPGVELREGRKAIIPGQGLGSGGTNLGSGSETSTSTSGGISTASSSGGLSPFGKSLIIGGGVVVVGWLGYGGFRTIECGGFGACDADRGGIDTTIDVVGGIGGAALAVGLIMYLTSDSSSEERLTSRTLVTPTVDSDSFGFAVGGQF